ncbi:MAG: ferredoxin--NADP(+) reductase [Spirochaetales bacterium]|nr:hypothetical protein [Leptospiraceae bacterium]MCP5480226.1 ferredoxin--NADP(+) reductase [Spirochaetales bacterium]MCP5486375.1 ferredoxin--NADP(+) reductase [Spirochaetales bacterium]
MTPLTKIEKHAPPAGARVYKLSAPFESTVLDAYRLTSEGSLDDVQHLVLDIAGSGMKPIEGQSIGVLPPGNQPNGKPHKLRLYSIASSRQGEGDDPDRLAICVKRLIEVRPDGGIYNGIASNFLCDLKPGDRLRLTGPVGPTFVLPRNPETNLVLIATGTGIAPFRAFLKYIYSDLENWRGEVMLIFGAKTQKELLYLNDCNSDLMLPRERANYHLLTARSREETRPDGAKLYVQDRVQQSRDRLLTLMKGDETAVYICGLKGMEAGLEPVFAGIAEELGRSWDEWKRELKQQGKWNIEVY